VDRETARQRMKAGLLASGFAAVVFALSFVVALLYIAS
jgi:sugar phosphate permease